MVERIGAGRPAGRRIAVTAAMTDETARVNGWGERHGINRSDAIRAMIREALDREKEWNKRR